jgi:hypothetical protein
VFEGLTDVDWAALGADEVPDLLCALTDESRAFDAWWDLDDLLTSHEHTAPNGTPALATAVLPFLVDLASDPSTMVRSHVLAALSDLWETDTAPSIETLDPAWTAAWSAQVPRLLRLLDDPDDGVRRQVLLALVATTADDDVAWVLDGLRKHWYREPDDLTRVDLALAIGRLERLDPTDPVHEWLCGLLVQDDDVARLTAAAVLVKVDPGLERAQHVLAAAVRAGDLPPWERRSWLAEVNRSAADWGANAWGRLARRVHECVVGLDSADEDTRTNAVREGALLLASWRSPEDTLLPAIAARLGDESAEAQAYAVHLLAACGAASAPFADEVAALLGDKRQASRYADESIGDLAVWALARMGDRRCVYELREQVRGTRPGFSVWSSAGGHPQFYMLDMPAMHQVLGPLRELAPDLMPAVRERLRASDDYQWQREMAQTLAAWGADGAEAEPELIDVLSTDAAGWAAHALGQIGPAAAAAAPALRRLARGPAWTERLRAVRRADEEPGRPYPLNEDRRPQFDADNRMQAAWAYAKITGDTDLAVRVLGRGLEGESARPAARLLATLGPLDGKPPPEHLVGLVEELVRDGDEWDRIDAAQIHWRLTGDPRVAVDRMLETLKPLDLASFEPPMRLAVTYVGELGSYAAAAEPALRSLLALDQRLGQTGGWQSIEEDVAIRHAAKLALHRIAE